MEHIRYKQNIILKNEKKKCNLSEENVHIEIRTYLL